MEATELFRFCGGLLLAIFGLGFIAFGGMIPPVFASGPIIMIMGLIMMAIAGYIMSKTWPTHKLIGVDPRPRHPKQKPRA